MRCHRSNWKLDVNFRRQRWFIFSRLSWSHVTNEIYRIKHMSFNVRKYDTNKINHTFQRQDITSTSPVSRICYSVRLSFQHKIQCPPSSLFPFTFSTREILLLRLAEYVITGTASNILLLRYPMLKIFYYIHKKAVKQRVLYMITWYFDVRRLVGFNKT